MSPLRYPSADRSAGGHPVFFGGYKYLASWREPPTFYTPAMALFSSYVAALTALVILFQVHPVEGMQACVWVTGRLVCHQDPAKAAFAEVRVYDADGLFWPIPSFLDPDDFMESTHSEHNGSFKVSGCGEDPNWFLIPNRPDPYLRIIHYCGSVDGLILELEEFDTYTPNWHHAGVIELDALGAGQPSKRAFTLLCQIHLIQNSERKIRPLHPKARVEDEGCLVGHVIQVEPSSQLCRFSNVVRMGHACDVIPGAEPAVALAGWVGNCPRSWQHPTTRKGSRMSGQMQAHYHRHPVFVSRCVWEVNVKDEDLPTWSEECKRDEAPSNFMIHN